MAYTELPHLPLEISLAKKMKTMLEVAPGFGEDFWKIPEDNTAAKDIWGKKTNHPSTKCHMYIR